VIPKKEDTHQPGFLLTERLRQRLRVGPRWPTRSRWRSLAFGNNHNPGYIYSWESPKPTFRTSRYSAVLTAAHDAKPACLEKVLYLSGRVTRPVGKPSMYRTFRYAGWES
jgi:hypothetical protein